MRTTYSLNIIHMLIILDRIQIRSDMYDITYHSVVCVCANGHMYVMISPNGVQLYPYNLYRYRFIS